MAKLTNLQTAEEKFARSVIKEARTVLTKKRKNASKELYNSLSYEIDDKNTITFFYAEQGKFIEAGRKKGDKMPPIASLKKWAKAKGLDRWRDKKGRYISADSQAYLIGLGIKHKGIKPLKWFSDPFERALKRFPEIVEAALVKDFQKDIDEFVESI